MRGLVSLAALCLVCASGLAQPTITPLGALPGGTGSNARGASADGSIVAGSASLLDAGVLRQHAFRWVYGPGGGTMTDLGALAPEKFSYGLGLSGDGAVVIGQSGSSTGDRAVRWTQATGLVNLGVLQPSDAFSYAGATNADGSVVVGYSFGFSSLTLQAFRWTQATGMVGLGVLPGFTSSEATCVNGDGTIVVGTCSLTPGATGPAFVWTSGLGMTELPSLTPLTPATRPFAMTPDGSTIVGLSSTSGGNRAFRWTSGSGTLSLGTLPGDTTSEAYGVSADGLTVVGRSTGVRNKAFVWNATLGMIDLRAQLVGLGSDLSNWGDLLEARAVSADSSVIAGTGVFQGVTQAFVIRNYPTCVPILSVQPEDRSTCAASTVSLGVTATGLPPLSYQWQIEDAETPGGWRTLFNGPLVLGGASEMSVAIIESFAGYSSLVSFIPEIGGRTTAIAGRKVRCQISSNCQGTTTREAMLNICVADINCDGFVDDADFQLFTVAYDILVCEDAAMPLSCPSDFNRDDVVDDLDFQGFASAYNELLCP
ncbi:MAG: hypothetical protein K2Y21_01655 [Phycisphaerales bacterium]|nr:hypothetical protein [Phycisphaerales bacterium]